MNLDQIYEKCKKMELNLPEETNFPLDTGPAHEEFVQFVKRLEELATIRSRDETKWPTAFSVRSGGGVLVVYYYKIRFERPTHW